MPLLRRRIHFWLAGALGALVVRLLSATWRVQRIDPDSVGDRVVKRQHRLFVAFWHRHLLSLLCIYRGYPLCVPVSEHRDGEYVAQVMERYGYLAVRGSTTRGSRRMLRDLLAAVRAGWNCAITPDGPRGPKFSVQPGIIMLARRTGMPVYPVGVAAEKAWVMNSWDEFVIPKPRTKVAVVVGEPLSVDELRAGETKALCKALGERIHRATDRARRSLSG